MSLHNHRFLKACRREATDCTPVWFMRQAGRYMAEYRAIRKDHSFLGISTNPTLTTEVTLQPIRAFDVDAAIIFADIMTPLEGAGIPFDIEAGVGPVVEDPIRTVEQLGALKTFDAEAHTPYLLDAIGRVTTELAGERPLIGFAGAPFTLACYIMQGRGSKSFEIARTAMLTQPDLWSGLMQHLAETLTTYLKAQIQAGASAVQLFDSWVGLLSPEHYRRYVLPYTQHIFRELADTGVPTIHFGTGTTTLLEIMKEAGGDVIGVDWRIPLDQGWERIGYDRAIQGNLDPIVLLSDIETIDAHMHDILRRAAGRPGHIFNLGHGILRTTPPEHVAHLARAVHDATRV